MSGFVDIKSTLRVAMAIAAFAVALSVPATATASECAAAGSDPTAAQYCNSVEIITNTSETNNSESNNSESASSESVAGTSDGSLPFTGADLLVLLAVAAAFVAIGLALQRMSRARTNVG